MLAVAYMSLRDGNGAAGVSDGRCVALPLYHRSSASCTMHDRIVKFGVFHGHRLAVVAGPLGPVERCMCFTPNWLLVMLTGSVMGWQALVSTGPLSARHILLAEYQMPAYRRQPDVSASAAVRPLLRT